MIALRVEAGRRRLHIRPPQRARRALRPADRSGLDAVLEQDRSAVHWADDYAKRLMDRAGPAGVLIQTSMSPSGDFHVGNFRDTVTAHLVARAVRRRGGRARILLSFDDYDGFRPAKVASDPVLADFGSRPLADATDHANRICRAYIAELKAVGICPLEADADGRLVDGSDWQTHYQAERYRGGEYLTEQRRFVRDRRRVASLLGIDDADRLFVPYCARCGKNTTEIRRLSPSRAAYSCRSCEAELTTNELGTVKPGWTVDWMLRVLHEDIDCEPAGADHCSAGSTMDRTQPVYARYLGRPQPVIVPYGLVRQNAESRKVSGSSGGGLVLADLLAVMSPLMIRWLYARPNCRADMRIALDLASLNRWYREFDAFRDAAADGDVRARVLWELLTDDEPRPAGPDAPSFRRISGAVQSSFFDLGLAADRLGISSLPAPEASVVLERLTLAKNWLGTHGRSSCWLPAEAQPCPRHAHRVFCNVVARFSTAPASDAFTPLEYHAMCWMLFGSTTGPPLSAVRQAFGRSTVVDALEAFVSTGRRPLAELLQARLAARGRA